MTARVIVVNHYAEVNTAGKAVDWEQDFAVTLMRGRFRSWRVSGVRTMQVALMQTVGVPRKRARRA